MKAYSCLNESMLAGICACQRGCTYIFESACMPIIYDVGVRLFARILDILCLVVTDTLSYRWTYTCPFMNAVQLGVLKTVYGKIAKNRHVCRTVLSCDLLLSFRHRGRAS